MKSIPPLKLGLVGRRISHSRSRELHQELLAQRGLVGTYEVFDIEADEMPTVLARCWEDGYVGLNVTTPYKQVVANSVGAEEPVNTLWRGADFWQGVSTDGVGFVRGLARISSLPPTFWRTVIILGAGGVLPSLLGCFEEGQSVQILRRSARNDETLRKVCPKAHMADLNLENFKKCLMKDPASLVIQASSAPLHGDEMMYLTPALEIGAACLIDLVYGRPSQLYSRARELGILCQDGSAMLEEQAKESQRLWFDGAGERN
ncbi:MAG: hypothetical protein HYW48_11625 [Deltaproteobacteria bacterium]|nr:hypothetical protein [Deltaproteobacteria bacterium]